MNINTSKISKFLAVGVTAGLSSATNAITVAATSVAVSASSHHHIAQKTIEAATDPANMTFIQKNPGLVLIGFGAFSALSIFGAAYVAAKSMINSDDEKHNYKEDKSSIFEKINNFRQKFTSSSSTSKLNI